MTPINKNGFTLIEIILAIALFGMMSLVVLSSFIYGHESNVAANDRTRASEIANEGTEAVRNISNSSYSNLASYINGTSYYLTTVGSQWSFVTTPATIDSKFTRTVVFGDGPNGSKKVTVTVTWQQSLLKQGSVSSVSYLANWKAATSLPSKTGLFVYANGGTSTDAIAYRLILPNGSWTSATSLLDVDPNTSSRVARSIKLFSAQTGSSKVAMSRHYDGTKQYVYAQVWNGSVWGNVQLMGSWTSSSNLDVGNFSGAYLANGTFVAIYSDGTNTPKSRTFNGTSWSTQTSLPAMGSSSNVMINMLVKARPSSNEAMAAFLGSDADVESSYYSNSAWSAYTSHTTNSVSSTSRIIDFAWSGSDNTTGLLIYTANPNDKSMRARTFTADNSGSGSWQPVANTSNQPSGSVVHSLGIAAKHSLASDFIACDKDDQASPSIYCYKLVPGSNGFSDSANKLITSATDLGDQRSFDLDYEYVNTNVGLIAYSDNTPVGKIKRFDTAANSWDQNPISMTAASGVIQRTRIVAKPNTSDAMVIVADGNKNLSSVMYDGTNNNFYTTGDGKSWTNHNTTGPSNNATWFDFAWDN